MRELLLDLLEDSGQLELQIILLRRERQRLPSW